jgi:hypothetical protein
VGKKVARPSPSAAVQPLTEISVNDNGVPERLFKCIPSVKVEENFQHGANVQVTCKLTPLSPSLPTRHNHCSLLALLMSAEREFE